MTTLIITDTSIISTLDYSECVAALNYYRERRGRKAADIVEELEYQLHRLHNGVEEENEEVFYLIG